MEDDGGTYTREKQKHYLKLVQPYVDNFKTLWKEGYKSEGQPEDFDKIRIVGTGAFGVVYLVRYQNTNQYFAMKMLEKQKIYTMKQIDHSLYEKKILCSIDFPFVVSMEYFFKDNVYLYMVLPYIAGGEMFSHLRKMGKFDESTAQFYASQVILGIEYLHTCNLVYRDLKPENILIDDNGYIKITDFGFCKVIRDRTFTLCGTPEYLAPEIIMCKGYGKSVDWWAIGVLIYEMNAGYPPFYSSDPMKIYERVVDGKYKNPKHFSPELRDLLIHVLQVDVSNRYGCLRDGVLDFKKHRWFYKLEWDKIFMQQLEAPIIPVLTSPGDTTNYDEYDEVKIKEASQCLLEKDFEDF